MNSPNQSVILGKDVKSDNSLVEAKNYEHLGWLAAKEVGIVDSKAANSFVMYLQLRAPEIDFRLSKTFGDTPTMFVSDQKPNLSAIASALAFNKHVPAPVLKAISEYASELLLKDLKSLADYDARPVNAEHFAETSSFESAVPAKAVFGKNSLSGVQAEIERKLAMLNVKLFKSNLHFSLKTNTAIILSSTPFEEKTRINAGLSPRPSMQLIDNDVNSVNSVLMQSKTQAVARSLVENWRAASSILSWLEKRDDLRGYRQDVLGYVNVMKADPEAMKALKFAQVYTRQPGHTADPLETLSSSAGSESLRSKSFARP